MHVTIGMRKLAWRQFIAAAQPLIRNSVRPLSGDLKLLRGT